VTHSSVQLQRVLVTTVWLGLIIAGPSAADDALTAVRVSVRSEGQALYGATVAAGALLSVPTDERGEAVLSLPAGEANVTVTAVGYTSFTTTITVGVGPEQSLDVELEEAAATHEEEVIVTATRSGRRVEDEALRVEVLSREEIEEKLLMTPSDISMLLNETSGLRVQVASPSLGAANVRVQGLRGRYTQLLSDGLPLYGGQSGSISLLQIPPMDLGQVEVIKGVASALYGASALGGVINLVSRRPAETGEGEVLLNQTTEVGTDAVFWASGPGGDRAGYTFLGGAHRQTKRDIDEDGWADLPEFERFVLRPRGNWENGAGRSLFLTAGAMLEDRQGGTMPGSGRFASQAYAESLSTRRFDAGLAARLPWAARLVSLKGSGVTQRHRHTFGAVRESDVHDTFFTEASVSATAGRHTWVAGAALQVEQYRSRDLPVFDYTHTTPALFIQDELALTDRATLAASARLDHHSVYGAFFNPRVSLLLRPTPWTVRLSGGTGSFAPTPFTEETEAVGLSRLAPLGTLRAERAFGASLDVGRTFGPVEANATAFVSTVRDPLSLVTSDQGRLMLVNTAAPTRTFGGELLVRWRREPFVATGTYTLTHSTEQLPGEPRLEVPLTPRHALGLVSAWERHGVGRVGVELYYVGRQRLADNPFRPTSRSYVILGALAERRFGRVRVFLNAENLSDARQTRHDPLVRPFAAPDGRRTVDVWAPLEGRIFNAGIRVGF
jgi:outer membrane receptor for ferrienterochelin and colicins